MGERTPYTASKGAVVQMTRSPALETAADGITANVIFPGPFLSEMNLLIANTEDGKKFIRLLSTEGVARPGGFDLKRSKVPGRCGIDIVAASGPLEVDPNSGRLECKPS